MAPPSCPYFAGNFRGSSGNPCLLTYECGIPGSNPRVGIPAAEVPEAMTKFHEETALSFDAFETWDKGLPSEAPPALRLGAFATLLALALQKFLTIHPFANGNGHGGRALVAAQLLRFGYWLGTWPVEEAPEYTVALQLHRSGQPAQLEFMMLMMLKGHPLPLRAP